MNKDSPLRASQQSPAESDNVWFLTTSRISLFPWLTAQRKRRSQCWDIRTLILSFFILCGEATCMTVSSERKSVRFVLYDQLVHIV
jgi:hypothetical protein